MNKDNRQRTTDNRQRTTDDVLDALRMQQPKVENEEAFVDDIMELIETQESPTLLSTSVAFDKKNNQSSILHLFRTFSSIAAAILIGWFIFLNTGDKPSSSEEQYSDGYTYSYSKYSNCSTIDEVIRLYFENKNNSRNNLISQYNEK